MALPPSSRRPASGPLQIPGFEELTAKLEALRELIEVGAGQRRDARYKGVTHLDRWVTVRELIELGILTEPDRVSPNIINPGMTLGSEPTGPIPDAITGLRADIDGFSVILSWEQPAAIVSYVEIWRADVDNVNAAVRIGQSVIDQSTGSRYVDKVGAVGSLYYWARNVSKGNQVGPMTGPVVATTDPVEAPTDLQIASGTDELLIASDGTIITRAKLTWTDSIDPSAIKYTLQYKRSADSVWLNLPQAEKGVQVAWAYPLKDNTEYDFRARADRINGDVSDWVTVTNYLVLGKQQPPSDVTGLSFDGVYLTWNPIGDLDRLGYIARYRTDGLIDWDTATPAHGREYLTNTRLDTRDLVAGAIKFLVKAVDTSGNESVTAAVINAELRPSDVGTLTFDGVYLSWPEIADLDRKGYIVRYRTDGGTDWTTATPAHGSGFLTEARFDTRLLVGGAVKFLVKAVDIGGNESINAATQDADLRPPTPASFLITRQPDGTREFTWSHSSPPDDLAGARIRYYLGTTSDWAVMNPLHDGLLLASPYESNLLAAGTYTFAIKYVDQAGNESAAATFITTTLGDPRLAGAIEDINEAPTWTATKTNCHVDVATGWLVADGTATWATLPATWGGWNQWNASPVSPITYLREIDIGVVTTFTPLVSVTFDGTATVEESHSNDGISWSSYAAVGPVLTARFIRIRATVSGSYPKLKMMRTILSGSPITEVIEDLNTANLTGSYRIGVGDVRLPITKSYAKIKKVGLTLQSVGAGWSWELIDKDTSVGPRVKIYNASNALADAVIDADISGL